MADYDIGKAFDRIENDLIASMIRNLKRHKAEETKMGIEWEQWQSLQLRELDRYRRENPKRFAKDFQEINKQLESYIKEQADKGQSKEEERLKKLAKQGKIKSAAPTDDNFLKINDQRLNAMLDATKADFNKAEYSLLRKADDEYRKVIFDAQVYANTTNDYNKAVKMAVGDFGKNQVETDTEAYMAQGMTYEQAVDRATKDMLENGIRPIIYRNGSQHDIGEYSRMVIRTTGKRAYLMGEGVARDKYGIHTVQVVKRTHACPFCLPFLGKVLVDDVYSGGTWEEAKALGVPTLSQAMDEGFLHPNCKDVYDTYIPGVDDDAEPWTKEEVEQIAGNYNQEQELNHAKDMKESYERMAKYSLDNGNQERYKGLADKWGDKVNELENTPAPPVEVEPPVEVAPPVEPTITPVEPPVEIEPRTYEWESKPLEEQVKAYEEAKKQKEWIDATYKEYEQIKAEADIFDQNIADVLAEKRADFPAEFNPQMAKTLDYIEEHLKEFESGTFDAEIKAEIEALQRRFEQAQAEIRQNIETLKPQIAELQKNIIDTKPIKDEHEQRNKIFKIDIDWEVRYNHKTYEDAVNEYIDRNTRYIAEHPKDKEFYEKRLNRFLYIRDHLEDYKSGRILEIQEQELDAIKKRNKEENKRIKPLLEKLKNEYSQLEILIGSPNVNNLSGYGERVEAIKQKLLDAPARLRELWNQCADNFHIGGSGKKAYYSPSTRSVTLSIRSAEKGSDYQTPYQVVFHEYGHAIDWELNMTHGNGKKSESFTSNYKDGIFGKTIQKEANAMIEKFAIENGYVDLPNKGTIMAEANRMVTFGQLSSDEKMAWVREQLQTPRIDRVKAEQAFCNYIKEKYTLLQRTDVSDMFESIMTTKQYPFGVGHGRDYWGSRGTSWKPCGEEAFAEMYSAMVANQDSWDVIQEMFPESVKIFNDIMEVTRL